MTEAGAIGAGDAGATAAGVWGLSSRPRFTASLPCASCAARTPCPSAPACACSGYPRRTVRPTSLGRAPRQVRRSRVRHSTGTTTRSAVSSSRCTALPTHRPSGPSSAAGERRSQDSRRDPRRVCARQFGNPCVSTTADPTLVSPGASPDQECRGRAAGPSP